VGDIGTTQIVTWLVEGVIAAASLTAAWCGNQHRPGTAGGATMQTERRFRDGSAVEQDPDSRQWWAITPRGFLAAEENPRERMLYPSEGEAAAALRAFGYAPETEGEPR
jgi:hypothetical protein